MTLEINLSVVALIVSLVALVISSGQFAQQIFGTADGYRRCQDSVIGPWSRKTRLVWRWTQFRFETKFTTPEIVLHTRTSNENDYKLNHLSSSHKRQATGDVIELGHEYLPHELRETFEPTKKYAEYSRNGDTVTWISFLRQLYLLQSSKHDFYDFHEAHRPQSDSRIGVIYRERTWDLMPPDMTLPVASSRLGTLIVLALRLGMTWENLDVGEGILRATGNGHTLIATTIRGLGITFQYSFNPDAEIKQTTSSSEHIWGVRDSNRFIPSRTTDLMACGFMPGNSRFGIPTIPLTGQTSAETGRLLTSALSYIGVPRSSIGQLTKTDELDTVRENGGGSIIAFAINDMIALLSDFQPLRNSSCTRTIWPMQTDVALSAFLFYESRERLLQLLRERPAVAAPGQNHLKEVETQMSKIEQKYSDDFYCRWDKAIANDPIAPPHVKFEFIADLREIHDWTTAYFDSVQKTLGLAYKTLVGAHIVLATQASATAFDETETANDYWTVTPNRYVDELPALIERLQPVLQAQNSEKDQVGIEQAIEEAWWTLMLRGLAWRMSIYVSHEETVIPSKLYYDQTPVYIM